MIRVASFVAQTVTKDEMLSKAKINFSELAICPLPHFQFLPQLSLAHFCNKKRYMITIITLIFDTFTPIPVEWWIFTLDLTVTTVTCIICIMFVLQLIMLIIARPCMRILIRYLTVHLVSSPVLQLTLLRTVALLLTPGTLKLGFFPTDADVYAQCRATWCSRLWFPVLFMLFVLFLFLWFRRFWLLSLLSLFNFFLADHGVLEPVVLLAVDTAVAPETTLTALHVSKLSTHTQLHCNCSWWNGMEVNTSSMRCIIDMSTMSWIWQIPIETVGATYVSTMVLNTLRDPSKQWWCHTMSWCHRYGRHYLMAG